MCVSEQDAEGNSVLNLSPYNVGCLDYGRAERMHGVWYWGFEESSFLEGARTVPLTRDIREDRPEYASHLTFGDDAGFSEIDKPDERPGCAQAIYLDFIGRRAVRGYGRAGLSDDVEVIQVEKVLDSRFVGYVSKTMKGRPYTAC